MSNTDDQQFINKQFNTLTREVLTEIESEVVDKGLLDILRPRVKTVIRSIWDRFTIRFGDESSLVPHRKRYREEESDN